MDIKLIKKAKTQCESEIRAIVVMFEKQSQLVVEQIRIGREFQTIGFPSEVTVKMDIGLRD